MLHRRRTPIPNSRQVTPPPRRTLRRRRTPVPSLRQVRPRRLAPTEQPRRPRSGPRTPAPRPRRKSTRPRRADASGEETTGAEAKEYVETLTATTPPTIPVDKADHFVTQDSVVSLVPEDSIESITVGDLADDETLTPETPITVVREVEQIETAVPEQLIADSGGNLDTPLRVVVTYDDSQQIDEQSSTEEDVAEQRESTRNVIAEGYLRAEPDHTERRHRRHLRAERRRADHGARGAGAHADRAREAAHHHQDGAVLRGHDAARTARFGKGRRCVSECGPAAPTGSKRQRWPICSGCTRPRARTRSPTSTRCSPPMNRGSGASSISDSSRTSPAAWQCGAARRSRRTPCRSPSMRTRGSMTSRARFSAG